MQPNRNPGFGVALIVALTACTGSPHAQDAPSLMGPESPEQQGEQPDADRAAAAVRNPAPQSADCGALPGHTNITRVLREVVAAGDKEANGGLGNHMWAVTVNRAGVVCTVTYSGESFGDQWPGSRAIAAQKAFAANAFSVPQFSLSTANLYWPAQPGKSLYGLETGNPVRADLLYTGAAPDWGTPQDPLIGSRVGGSSNFAGGLALYSQSGDLIGGLGLSGDESCTDHVIAWKVRHRLNLDNVPNGVAKDKNDNIIHDITTDPATGKEKSASEYGHPSCSPAAERIAENLSKNFPTGPAE